MPEDNFTTGLLPAIKKKGQSRFHQLAVNDTSADVVVVYDHNDEKANDYIDTIVRSLFIDSAACCTCEMDPGALRITLAEVMNNRRNTLGDIANGRPCKVLILLRGESFDPNPCLSIDTLPVFIEVVKEAGAECEICCLKERTGTGELPIEQFDLPNGASRCWITFSDSTGVSLVLLLMLSGHDPSGPVVVVDSCAMYNATEFSVARYAKGFLNTILNEGEQSFKPKEYWMKIINKFWNSFNMKYPVQAECLPYYQKRSVIPAQKGTIAEYYGIMENGTCVSEHYFDLLLEKCKDHVETAFKQPSVIGAIPIRFFTVDEKYTELNNALECLRKNPAVARRSYLQNKASRTELMRYNEAWQKDFSEACENKFCELLIEELGKAKKSALHIFSTARDLQQILNGNYKSDTDSSVTIPDGKNWYNYRLSDLINTEATGLFTSEEYQKIIDNVSGIAKDADSDCRNYAFMNNTANLQLIGGCLVSIGSMPEGLIVSGRARWQATGRKNGR